MMENLFVNIFENIAKNNYHELDLIKKQFEFEEFKCKVPVLKITFKEGVVNY